MDKTTRDYAFSLALHECVCGDNVLCSHKKSYEKGYLRAIDECNVSQLQEENERLREALKSTRLLNLHLYEEGTSGNRVYNIVESAIKATK